MKKTVTAVILSAVFFPAANASADDPGGSERTELDTSALRDCIESELPVERRKKAPQLDRLLKSCQRELDTVIAAVPDEHKQEVRKVIVREFARMLHGG